jgi:hypothetical protein
MKRILVFFIIFASLWELDVLADVPETNEWGSVIDNIQIGIGIEGNAGQIKTNQQVDLTIRIKNTSANRPFNFYRPAAILNGFPMYYEVISPSGKDISPAHANGFWGSGGIMNVPPNSVYNYEFNLGYLCRFNEVGTYKVVAKMNLTWTTAHTNSLPTSNRLYVTVVPGQ